jgi:hypothetical protein
VVTAVSQAQPLPMTSSAPVVVMQRGPAPGQLVRFPGLGQQPATILVSPTPSPALVATSVGGGGGGHSGSGLLLPFLPSAPTSNINVGLQQNSPSPSGGQLVVKKLCPATTASPPPQRLLPQARMQQQMIVTPTTMSGGGTPLPSYLPQEPVPPQLPNQPLTAAQLQTGGNTVFQRPLPFTTQQQGRTTPTAMKTVVVQQQQQQQHQQSRQQPRPKQSHNSGTPLPDHLFLPSVPVPISQQELIKLRSSPSDAIDSEAALFSSPHPSPSARTLSRSSSLASNGSMSPSAQIVNGATSGGGGKQIFVKVSLNEMKALLKQLLLNQMSFLDSDSSLVTASIPAFATTLSAKSSSAAAATTGRAHAELKRAAHCASGVAVPATETAAASASAAHSGAAAAGVERASQRRQQTGRYAYAAG